MGPRAQVPCAACRDFPVDFLTAHGVTVSSADDYLTGLFTAGRWRSSKSSAVLPPRSNGGR